MAISPSHALTMEMGREERWQKIAASGPDLQIFCVTHTAFIDKIKH